MTIELNDNQIEALVRCYDFLLSLANEKTEGEVTLESSPPPVNGIEEKHISSTNKHDTKLVAEIQTLQDCTENTENGVEASPDEY